jgi:hypothetical protein
MMEDLRNWRQMVQHQRRRWLSSGTSCHVVGQKFADVSEVLVTSIISVTALMMEATNTFETPADFYQTT